VWSGQYGEIMRLEVVYYHLVQRKHNTGSEGRWLGGSHGPAPGTPHAHRLFKGNNLHVRLSDISRSQSQAYDRGRSSIDHGSPLTDSRYRSKLIVLHEGSVLQQSLTNMKVSPLFVLERFAYTHTYTSFIRRANRSSRPEPASLQTSKS
jgi:hypothetical protein